MSDKTKYDETNVPGPEYRVRPVVRYLVTVYFHSYMAKDQHGFPLPIEGSSKVIGEFDRDDNAELVRDGLQKQADAQHARMRGEPDMVTAEPEDMDAALVQISNTLGCQCNLEDILHSIDQIRALPPAPPSPTVLVRDGVPVSPSGA